MKPTLVSALFALALVGAPVAAQGSVAARDTNVVLQPGDMVKVTVWRNPEMSGDFVVGVNGALRHPLYREVPIAGVPMGEVEARLTRYLTKFEQNPQLVVEPLFKVTVGGEVRTPNLYPLPRTTTISQAVALAGGVTPDGQLNKVNLYRAGRMIEMDLTEPSGRWSNEPIQSGDQIIVTKKSNFMRNVFLPLVSVAGAVASIINVARRR